MTALGLAHLTALDLAPRALITEAARCGFRSVGLRVHPATVGGAAYPTRVGTWSHRELAHVLRSEGMRLNEIEFIQITPGIEIGAYEPLFEAGTDLGAASVTVSGDDPDTARLTANFAALCELAGRYGLRVDLEFMRWRAVATVGQAEAVVRGAGRSNGAILVDALHLSRSGGQPEDLRAIPASMLRAAQLCDADGVMPKLDEDIVAEAREGRLPPGEGTLPLAELLAALPADATLSVEMPSRDRDAKARIATAYAATQRLLDRCGRAAGRVRSAHQ
ncbi:sugar phosphate isomerase/epimerase family protein [Bosea sp. NPDC055332]